MRQSPICFPSPSTCLSHIYVLCGWLYDWHHGVSRSINGLYSVSTSYSYSLVNNILLYGFATFYLFILQMLPFGTDMNNAAITALVWALERMRVPVLRCGTKVGLLRHMLILCLTSRVPPGCFPKWVHHVASAPAVFEGSILSQSVPTYANIWLILLVGVKWYLTVALICISQMAKDIQNSSWAYWPFVFPL